MSSSNGLSCPIHPIADDPHCPSCKAWGQIDTARKTLALEEQRLDLDRQLLRSDKKQLRKTAKVNQELTQQCGRMQSQLEGVTKERDELSTKLSDVQDAMKEQEVDYSDKLHKKEGELERLKSEHQEIFQKTQDAQSQEHQRVLGLQDEIKRLEKAHGDELSELEQKHEKVLEGLKAKNEQALQKLTDESEAKRRAMGEEHQKIASELQEQASMQQLQAENYAEQLKVLGLIHNEEKMASEQEQQEVENQLDSANAKVNELQQQLLEEQEAKQQVESDLQKSKEEVENLKKMAASIKEDHIKERKKLEREMEKSQRQQRIHLTAAVGNAAVAKSTQAHVENLENEMIELEKQADKYKHSNEELVMQLDDIKQGGGGVDASQLMEMRGRIDELEQQQEEYVNILRMKDMDIEDLKLQLEEKDQHLFESKNAANFAFEGALKSPASDGSGIDGDKSDSSNMEESTSNGKNGHEAMLSRRSSNEGRHVTEFPYSMEAEGGRYTGFVNGDGAPDGRGTFRSEKGDIYEGEWKNGKRHGHGVYTWFDGDLFTGSWLNNKRHGHGVFVWADGRMYDGEYVDNLREGKGIFTWPYGARYEGEYHGDKRSGHGVYVYADGRKYSGEYKDERPHGQGVEMAVDGSVLYEGEWAFGEFVGPTNGKSKE